MPQKTICSELRRLDEVHENIVRVVVIYNDDVLCEFQGRPLIKKLLAGEILTSICRVKSAYVIGSGYEILFFLDSQDLTACSRGCYK